MYNPISTYRIQFHAGFTFIDLEQLIPYLQKLGIGTLYASPIFKAVPGSMHGYDGTDPLQINPEIGTIDDLRRVSKKLKKAGISWLQDIVPNHMAFHQDNKWLMDVLEKGPLSNFITYFDRPDNLYKAQIMVPFLGQSLEDVIAAGELKVNWNGSRLVFDYSGNQWPLNLASYSIILQAKTPAPGAALLKLVAREADSPAKLTANTAKVNLQMGKLTTDTTWLDVVNGDKVLLAKIADTQYYRLCNWQETEHTINYRRFFTVNGLIGLNIDRPEVFADFHQLIASLVKEEIFQGLRIDHIDGLSDPEAYLHQLRELVGKEVYIVAEKILETGEELNRKWPIEGTTGYDFLGMVNNLLTDRAGEATLSGFYKSLVHRTSAVSEQIGQKKRYILEHQMAGEWDNLAHLFIRSELAKPKTLLKVPFKDLRDAIGEFLIQCPVYRYYGNEFPLSKKEGKAVKKILKSIAARDAALAPAIKMLNKALINNPDIADPAVEKKVSIFYQRCMQLTGPLMAKGVEDTLMYTENHFVAHNEVGDSPDAGGMNVNTFHQLMQQRQKQWPLAMNATATHDTKRGDDVRARLQGLTEVADDWAVLVRNWMEFNQYLKVDGQPDTNDEYLVYQTLLGAYPMPAENTKDFGERITAYLEKALREGKQHSNWAAPDEGYEQAVKSFANALLDSKSDFQKSFQPFLQKVEDRGIRHTLTQVLLKMTCPGVPDTYQGCEQWDFSLVDPDNRRPVDYNLRKEQLNSLDKKSVSDLWKTRFDGQIKLWLTHALLTERKNQPNVFLEGDYLPLETKGKYKESIIAFARKLENCWYVTAVALNEIADWEDTAIILPPSAPANFKNILQGGNGKIKGEILAKDIFNLLPVALLNISPPENNRKAGILMPLSSLPGPFSTGDLGPAAHQFASQLHAAEQQYWQLLPLNPVSAQQQYSPYSSPASFAGNILFISPELLLADGLLDSLNGYKELNGDAADFKVAGEIKAQLFDQAWTNFKSGQAQYLSEDLTAFCTREQYWLDDYAAFTVLKSIYTDKPWNEWPLNYRQRRKKAMADLIKNNKDGIAKAEFSQFIFQRQWNKLKKHCADNAIELFGDLPFYVSYDSADVWANQQFFALGNTGEMIDVAGVPPDYFNADGQLWGMPVFNWDKLKSTGYEWWIRRIKRNLELFDWLRLDHFRAFSSYWAVPHGETTAVNGEWKKGPGKEFFDALDKAIGSLPLVAEDLGDIDDDVYLLRDAFNLPGMKVLQFAFGDTLPYSPHAPHQHGKNFIVYTGTHDNNTTRGWLRTEAGKAVRRQLAGYFGQKVKDSNVAQVLIQQALSSVADTAIIPLQDWLNLDEQSRINTPGATNGNWTWRVNVEELAQLPVKKIRKLTKLYGRI